jgi:hypothetical protein
LLSTGTVHLEASGDPNCIVYRGLWMAEVPDSVRSYGCLFVDGFAYGHGAAGLDVPTVMVEIGI